MFQIASFRGKLVSISPIYYWELHFFSLETIIQATKSTTYYMIGINSVLKSSLSISRHCYWGTLYQSALK